MTLPDAIETIRPSVVQICYGEAILGTGFFVDDKAHDFEVREVTAHEPQIRWTLARPQEPPGVLVR
jgi:hypothetical protein